VDHGSSEPKHDADASDDADATVAFGGAPARCPDQFFQFKMDSAARPVARPKRFELLTPRFVVWFSRTQRDLTERTCSQQAPGL
jgi:hypothetical protein